jgi:hypothetical protein
MVWFPATSQLTLTTWNLTKHYRKTSNPFDFLTVAQLAYPGMLRCCEAPRPSCLLFKNLAAWAGQDWRCLSCGAVIEPYLADTELPIFKMYRRVSPASHSRSNSNGCPQAVLSRRRQRCAA